MWIDIYNDLSHREDLHSHTPDESHETHGATKN